MLCAPSLKIDIETSFPSLEIEDPISDEFLKPIVEAFNHASLILEMPRQTFLTHYWPHSFASCDDRFAINIGLDDCISPEDIRFVMLHEMVHIEQMYHERLEINSNGSYTFDGYTYLLEDYSDYCLMPHEFEANVFAFTHSDLSRLTHPQTIETSEKISLQLNPTLFRKLNDYQLQARRLQYTRNHYSYE